MHITLQLDTRCFPVNICSVCKKEKLEQVCPHCGNTLTWAAYIHEYKRQLFTWANVINQVR